MNISTIKISARIIGHDAIRELLSYAVGNVGYKITWNEFEIKITCNNSLLPKIVAMLSEFDLLK